MGKIELVHGQTGGTAMPSNKKDLCKLCQLCNSDPPMYKDHGKYELSGCLCVDCYWEIDSLRKHTYQSYRYSIAELLERYRQQIQPQEAMTKIETAGTAKAVTTPSVN